MYRHGTNELCFSRYSVKKTSKCNQNSYSFNGEVRHIISLRPKSYIHFTSSVVPRLLYPSKTISNWKFGVQKLFNKFLLLCPTFTTGLQITSLEFYSHN